MEIGGTDLKSRAIGSKKLAQKTVPDEASSKASSFKKQSPPGEPFDATPTPFFPSSQQQEEDLRREIDQLERDLDRLMEERSRVNEQVRAAHGQNLQGWDDGLKSTKVRFKQSAEEKQKEAFLLETEIEKLSKEVELLDMENVYTEAQLDQLGDVLASLHKQVAS